MIPIQTLPFALPPRRFFKCAFYAFSFFSCFIYLLHRGRGVEGPGKEGVVASQILQIRYKKKACSAHSLLLHIIPVTDLARM